MNTPTHLLVAAALWTKKEAPLRNTAVIVGAILPDLYLFVFFVWAQISNLSVSETWSVAYWQEPWQTFSAISNSIPLIILILAIGFLRKSILLKLLAAAMLAHVALDLPFHADDAHQHFWPLTSWRFNSPLSYWDPAHHGIAIMMVEVCFAIFLSIILWRRFSTLWVRLCLVVSFLTYISVPLYFIISNAGGH